MHWDESNEVVNRVGKYKYHYRRKDREVEWVTRELIFEMKTKDKMKIAAIADHFELDVQTVARYLRAAKKSYFGFGNPKNKITVREVNRQIEEERRENSARIKKKREEALYSGSLEAEEEIRVQK